MSSMADAWIYEMRNHKPTAAPLELEEIWAKDQQL